MNEKCGAYLVLGQSYEEGPIKIFCTETGSHELHKNDQLQEYCREGTDHWPFIVWCGDDGIADLAREAVWQAKIAEENRLRESRIAEERAQRRAWQASDAARQEFIRGAAKWLGKPPEEVALLVEPCPCDEDMCSGWRLKLGQAV